mgnify:FL=1
MIYMELMTAALCPVFAAAVLYLLHKRTSFGRLGEWKKQIVYGCVFGMLAIAGSRLPLTVGGDAMSMGDTAPLCAGLIFGSPAGILSGLIGGAERWSVLLWGADGYTSLAEAISVALAGLLGAALRRWMFDDKKPPWHYGFAAGLVTGVLHMLIVFFTNMDDVGRAFAYVKNCSLPMVLSCAVSAMLSALVVSMLGKEKLHMEKEHKKLSQSFSRWLLLVVLVAFCMTSVFTYILQTRFALSNSEQLLNLNINDVKADIEDASDENLLELTRGVAEDINAAEAVDNELLEDLIARPGNDFSEINVADQDGIIVCTTNPDYEGFDMASGEQSATFLALLGEKDELVQSYQPISADNGTYMKYAGAALEDGGFVQVGYNAERFRRDIDSQVIGATRNRHVGENGYMIIAADDWTIVSDPHGKEREDLSGTGIWIDRNTMPVNERFESTVYGEESYCIYTETEGYYIIAVEPVSEVLFSRDLSVFVTVFMEIIIFAVLFILVYLLIKKLVVENIHKINHSLSEITGGNLNVSVDVRTNEEFVSLSDDINSTVVTLKGYIAEAAARIDKELETAKIIQSSTLPSVFPPYPDRSDFDIFAMMDTAKEVGGDFYDFYLLDEDRLAFLIADVSGKGITAAMFMMNAKTLIKSYADKETDVAEILTKANRALCEGNDAEMFVTCWMGILSFTTHTVTFVNAGHNAPLIRRRDGRFEYFRSRHGFVLAGMEEMKYKSGQLKLYPGDEIFLYTDGVTEATDAHNELYGDERLLCALNGMGDTGPEEICRAVREDVDRFVGGAPQFDDITMLHLKLLPKNSVIVKPTEEGLEKVTAFVEQTLEDAYIPPKIMVKMNVAVDEIFSNIIRYSGASEAEVECDVRGGRIMLVFIDDGSPYDPTGRADPDTTLTAEERGIGGLGFFMVKKFMDSVEYSYRENRNILTLVKENEEG